MVVFLEKSVDAGDGLVAFTPNAVYTVEGEVATSGNRSHTVSLSELIAGIAAWRTAEVDQPPNRTFSTSSTLPR